LSAGRVLDLLDLLSRSGPLGVSEIARRMAVPKTVAWRLAETLHDRGYAIKDPDTRRYSLGLKVLELSASVRYRLEIVKVARPYIEELVEKCDETVDLGVYDKNEVVFVDKKECTRSVRMVSSIGRRLPLHCTGTGKALLAFLPGGEVDRVISRGLVRYTDNTITEPDELRRELSRVRADGYAVDRQEFEIGVRCVAAPVLDLDGRAVAAISIAGPAARITDERIPALAEMVKEAADGISRDLHGDFGMIERRTIQSKPDEGVEEGT
jgi:DNA-binding IclR family transcriptional regulator